MLELSKAENPIQANILGAWKISSVFDQYLGGDDACEVSMDRTDREWLPTSAVGDLVIWTFPTDDGGELFAAWVTEEGGVDWSELSHLQGGTFTSPTPAGNMADGLFLESGRFETYSTLGDGITEAEMQEELYVSTSQYSNQGYRNTHVRCPQW